MKWPNKRQNGLIVVLWIVHVHCMQAYYYVEFGYDMRDLVVGGFLTVTWRD